MTVGVILAAGMSTRMGRCKQLLPLGDKVVIQRVVEQVIGRLPRIFVVLGHREKEIAEVLKGYPVTCVTNPDYRTGMLSSVQCGIRAAGEVEGYLVCLGDQPGIERKTVDAVIAGATAGEKGLVIPTNRGKRGHPIWIQRRYREEILQLSGDRGLNAVTRGYPEDTLEVPVGDERVLVDLDTPADYQREIERLQEETGE